MADEEGLQSAPVAVDLLVQAPPATTADRVNTVKNRSVLISPLANDASTLSPATLKVFGSPAHGTVQVNTTTGEITYIPTTDFVGVDTFVYAALDPTSGIESDPTRVTVVVTGSAAQSSFLAVDVDNSGAVTPLDALLVINFLNRGGEIDVNVLEQAGMFQNNSGPFVDVNGSGLIQPIDALLVINALNQKPGAASGESGSATNLLLPPVSNNQDSAEDVVVDQAVSLADLSDEEIINIFGASAVGNRNTTLESVLNDLITDEEDEAEDSVDAFWGIIGGLK